MTPTPRITPECWRMVNALLAASARAPTLDERRRLFNQAEDLLRIAAAHPAERERVLQQALSRE